MVELPKFPTLTKVDYIALELLRKRSPAQFYFNATGYYISEMTRYIKNARIWRNAIMGETRGGKSETGSTICFLYVNIFNRELEKGTFDGLDVFTEIKKQQLTFDTKNIKSNQSDYIQSLRSMHKAGNLVFGNIWQIDETKENVGGIGSFTEMFELQNVNNIIAKFMQSEVWIQPNKLQNRNVPYGLYVYKKDLVHKVNWSLLYKIDMKPTGVDYKFIGWVSIPLHNNDLFRKEYNDMKNKWISNEIVGSTDERMKERKSVSKGLSEDVMFSMFNASGKQFKLSKTQQLTILEDWMLSGKTQHWNELEKYRIIEEARMLCMERQIKAKDEENKKKGDLLGEQPRIESENGRQDV